MQTAERDTRTVWEMGSAMYTERPKQEREEAHKQEDR